MIKRSVLKDLIYLSMQLLKEDTSTMAKKIELLEATERFN